MPPPAINEIIDLTTSADDTTLSPTFKFPADWYDDDTHSFYASPLRPNDLDECQTKLDYWKSLLLQYLQHQSQLHRLQHSVTELEHAFTYHGEHPEPLRAAIRELIEQGQLADVTSSTTSTVTSPLPRQRSAAQLTSPSRLTSIASHVASKTFATFSYALTFVSPSKQSATASDRTCISSQQAIDHHTKAVNNKLTAWCEQHNRHSLTHSELTTLLTSYSAVDQHLLLERLISSTKLQEAPPDDATLQSESIHLRVFTYNQQTPPTTADYQVALVYHHTAQLEQSIDAKQQQADQLTAKIKQLLGQQKRQQAMFQLQRRKQIDAQVDTMHKQLNNLHTIINNIEQAQSNTQLLKVMTVARNVLKQVESEQPVEDVDDLVADITESMAHINVVDDALNQPITIGDTVADEDVDAEYMAMHDELADEEAQSTPVKVTATSSHDDKLLSALADLPTPPTSLKPNKTTTTARTPLTPQLSQ